MDSSELSKANGAALIPEADVVEMVKLLGKVAGMSGDLSARKKALMDGLKQLLDADGWLWSATRVLPDQDNPMSVGVIYDGLTDEEFAGWVDASQVAKQCPPEDPPLTKLFLEGEHYTRTRQQLVPDDVWYNHPTVKQYRLERGLDHFLYTVYPIDGLLCSAIGFFRRVGRDPFTDIQRRICHILTGHVEWMHYATFPSHTGEAVPDMTPRLRTVLIYLLDAKKRDDIARLLHISPDTAKEHIRNVYRHFNVKSQTELMRYFQAGNGGDHDALPPQ